MVLLNIETLSDSEIRYIAQQEDLEDWDTMSREDLIDCLMDLYSDSDSPRDLSRSRDHKYFNTLASSKTDMSSLPGVSPISDKYNETYIHVVGRDSNWVYAFWEINESTKEEIIEKGDSLSIQICAKAKDKEPEQTFEIDVTTDDNNWNIELPWFGRDYVISLIRKSAGQDTVLCKTDSYYVASYYYAKNTKDLKDPDTYKLLVSSMLSKDGQLVDCQVVKEIVENA